MNDQEEKLLTADEVAAILQVQTNYIYQLKAQHKIPYHKVGKCLRFLRSEVMEWVKSN